MIDNAAHFDSLTWRIKSIPSQGSMRRSVIISAILGSQYSFHNASWAPSAIMLSIPLLFRK
ncbi:hypothetical protein D3C80_1713280 [compost metagenome]